MTAVRVSSSFSEGVGSGGWWSFVGVGGAGVKTKRKRN